MNSLLIGIGLVLTIVGSFRVSSLNKKCIKRSQVLILLGAFLLLYFFFNNVPVFTAIDSFTVGSIVFLITSSEIKSNNARTNSSIILLCSIGSVAFFFSGFIGTTNTLFPNSHYPLVFASLQNSLFFLGAINLTVSSIHVMGIRLKSK